LPRLPATRLCPSARSTKPSCLVLLSRSAGNGSRTVSSFSFPKAAPPMTRWSLSSASQLGPARPSLFSSWIRFLQRDSGCGLSDEQVHFAILTVLAHFDGSSNLRSQREARRKVSASSSIFGPYAYCAGAVVAVTLFALLSGTATVSARKRSVTSTWRCASNPRRLATMR
jgi:hypothetical protein